MKSTLLNTTIFLLWVLIRINGQRETSTCGLLGPNLMPLMTNSFPTHRWPWHAAIYHRKKQSHSYQCGGSVISSDSILTAAHCVSKYGVRMKANQVVASLGRLTLNITETDEPFYKVDEIIIHPNFSYSCLNNDIAIIKISIEANYNINIHPICLWKSSKIDISQVVGRYGTVVGFGRTEMGQTSHVLRQASLKVVESIECLESNRAYAGSFLTKGSFCAGMRNGTSVCNGDSGGSMCFEENGIYFIRGIVSSTPNKEHGATVENMCDSMEYAIFTDVARYLEWIRATSTIECPTTVRCKWDYWQTEHCTVVHNVERSAQSCKVIFNEASNSAVIYLTIRGESDVIPDLSDALAKFKNLEILALISMKLKIVDRARLTGFRSVKELDLYLNEITHLNPHTFDDLNNLFTLKLYSNNLRELHVDLFKELYNLEALLLNKNQLKTLPADIFGNNKKLANVYLSDNQLTEVSADLFKQLLNLNSLILGGNQLEVLPEGLFRNNEKLRYIGLMYNKLKRIECDFSNMPYLDTIDFRGNICISEECRLFCGTSSSIEMNEKIQRNCTN